MRDGFLGATERSCSRAPLHSHSIGGSPNQFYIIGRELLTSRANAKSRWVNVCDCTEPTMRLNNAYRTVLRHDEALGSLGPPAQEKGATDYSVPPESESLDLTTRINRRILFHVVDVCAWRFESSTQVLMVFRDVVWGVYPFVVKGYSRPTSSAALQSLLPAQRFLHCEMGIDSILLGTRGSSRMDKVVLVDLETTYRPKSHCGGNQSTRRVRSFRRW